jgi:hypothetical protein
MSLSRYKYSEVRFYKNVNNVSEEDGLWHGYMKMHSFITWSNVKAVAKRYLTDKQYYVFVKRGKEGLLYRELEEDLGISSQSSQERLDLAVKKLRKIFEKYLKTRYNIGRGFKFHVEIEKKLKAGEYNETFEKQKSG